MADGAECRLVQVAPDSELPARAKMPAFVQEHFSAASSSEMGMTG